MIITYNLVTVADVFCFLTALVYPLLYHPHLPKELYILN
jgi:hypothetical protein